jgi:hypothetical protein
VAELALGEELLLVVVLAEEAVVLGVHGRVPEVQTAGWADEAAKISAIAGSSDDKMQGV